MSRVQFVCYTSKQCNLRCSYCYELPLLGNPHRMSLEQVERMFSHVESHYRNQNQTRSVEFQWHGGEPLLIPPSYYRQIFEAQKKIFSTSHYAVENIIQSNFTILDDERIELLKEHFSTVGISLDLYGGLRQDSRGECLEARSIANLERARQAGLKVAGISVLTKGNADHIPDIYEFWTSRGAHFRLLPLEKGLYESGQDFELTPEQTLACLTALADLWLQDPSGIEVAPINRYFSMALHAHRHPENRIAIYDRALWESVLLVDTDGAVYTYGDRFDSEVSLGNLFEEPLATILSSDAHRSVIHRSHARVAATCSECPHLGRACTSDPIADGSQDIAEYDPQGRRICTVAHGLTAHLLRRLEEGFVCTERMLRTSAELARIAEDD